MPVLGGHVDVNLPRDVREADNCGAMKLTVYQSFDYL